MIQIRTMQGGDVAAVARLSEEAFGRAYRFDFDANAKALFKGSQSGRVHVAIAEADGRVVGYGNLRAWPIGGWIDQIAVSGDHRRAGVGRALLQAILEEARRRGYWKVSLVTSAADAAALAFFRSCGWVDVGAMKDEITPGIDGVLQSCIVDYGLHPNPS